MLASIHPLGERARDRRWGVTVTAYLAASITGGAAAGVLLGLAGRGVGLADLDSAWRAALVAGACALGLLVDVAAPAALPTVRRQVDEDWLHRYRGWVYGAGFGFQLGLGVVTIVTTAAVYVAFGLAFLTGSASAGLAIGAAFGLVRALPVLSVARVRRPDELRRAHARMQGWAGPARTFGLAAQAAVVAAAVAVALG